MVEEDTSLYLVLVLAVVAVVGLALSVASFATDQSMTTMMGGRGMMNGGGAGSAAGPGAFEWTVLVLSIALLAVAFVVLWRGRSRSAPPSPGPPSGNFPIASPPPSPPAAAVAAAPPSATSQEPPEPMSEPALVKLLDEDERRMYLELRGHGGEMLQRDLVALGIFSKAKVTRVLDKLEAKGVVVREAHGMTNRVRLVGTAPR